LSDQEWREHYVGKEQLEAKTSSKDSDKHTVATNDGDIEVNRVLETTKKIRPSKPEKGFWKMARSLRGKGGRHTLYEALSTFSVNLLLTMKDDSEDTRKALQRERTGSTVARSQSDTSSAVLCISSWSYSIDSRVDGDDIFSTDESYSVESEAEISYNQYFRQNEMLYTVPENKSVIDPYGYLRNNSNRNKQGIDDDDDCEEDGTEVGLLPTIASILSP
jgi:hypothetical protein